MSKMSGIQHTAWHWHNLPKISTGHFHMQSTDHLESQSWHHSCKRACSSRAVTPPARRSATCAWMAAAALANSAPSASPGASARPDARTVLRRLARSRAWRAHMICVYVEL